MIPHLQKIPKLIVLTIMLGFLPFSLYPQTFANSREFKGGEQKLSSTVKLRDAIIQLKNRYRVNILFEENLLEGITISDSLLDLNSGIEKNLNAVLEPSGLHYEKVKKNSYVIVSAGAPSAARTEGVLAPSVTNQMVNLADEVVQQPLTLLTSVLAIKVSGTVIDETGSGLPGVNIIEKGTTIGTTSDGLGNYSLNVTDENSVLVFSFIGYEPQEVQVGTRARVDVTLIPDVKSLSEVVVIGYGAVKKSDVTGAVSIVSAKDLGDRSATDIGSLLQGRAAGVDVTNGQIRIRGTNSISAGTDPLYVIDGLLGGDAGQIHPSDIETIQVLKDAGSTAIYGSRGANGVVIITTKKGKTGAPQVSYNNFFGTSTPSKRMDLLNAQQYMDLLKDIEVNGSNGVYDFTQSPKLFNPDGSFTNYVTTDRTDWQNEMSQTAPFSEHNLSFRGATDLVTYSVSGSFNDTKSTYGTSEWKNSKFGVNTEWKLFRGRLKVGEDFRAQSWTNTGKGVDFLGGMRMPSYSPVEDPNALGGYAYVTTTADLNDASNPVTDLKLSQNKGVGANFSLNLKADLEIIKGLNLRSSYAIFGGFNGNFSYIKPRQNGNLVFPDAQLDENSSYSLPGQTILENYLTYKKTIGSDHSFSAMVGNTVIKSGWNRGLNAQGKGFLNDEILTMNVAGVKTVGSNDIAAYAKLSYFGRVSYSYKSKYFVDANLRFDGSDSFGPSNRWGTFPAVNAAWKIYEEQFMTSVSVISFLKLRAGYGITGNDLIPQFSYFSSIHGNPAYAFPSRTSNVSNGKTINAAFNPAIQWEQVAALNIGLDIGILQDRLMLNVDYFNKETSKMLVDVPLPPSLGFGGNGGGGNAFVNAANLTNKGLELFLTAKDEIGDFSYTLTANATFVQNKVTNLSNGTPYNDGSFGFMSTNRTEVGQPVGYIYGFKMDMVYANQEQVDADNAAARAAALAADPTLTQAKLDEIFYISSSTKAGDIRFFDVNGDGIVNSDKDRTYLGTSQPPFMYGFAATLGYKGFDFFMNWNGRSGNSIVYGYGYWMEGMIRPFNSSTATLNRWKSEAQPGDGVTPRAVKTDPSGNLRMSDRFVYSGSFLRLSLVSLGYSVPREILDKAFKGSVQKFRVYISSDNPFTASNYPGLNPEVGGWSRGRGVDNGTLSVSRTFRAGLQLSF